MLVSGCATQSSNSSRTPYPELYHSASENIANAGNAQDTEIDITSSNHLFGQFVDLYSDIHHPRLEQLIEEVYAESIYFSDTLTTLTHRDDLVEYMIKTRDKVDFNKVKIQEITPNQDGYYVRWTMDTGFTVFGRSVVSNSIGITQVRFNQHGKVIFHQDFWDSTEGVFRHIPIVGFFLNRAMDQL